MESNDPVRESVKQKYGELAMQDKSTARSSCCSASNIMTDDYSGLEGYSADADLGLGCGVPTQFAQIKNGDTVIDLGSGAGNECFVARAQTGPDGAVIGIDFTPAMIEQARANAKKLGYTNVEFREGDIEKIPVEANVADVVISNCVLNLVPDKQAAFREIFRVLKPGGHFSISDVVVVGDLPDALRQEAEAYAGCIAGAIQRDEYIALIARSGFVNAAIPKQKPIPVPDHILKDHLQSETLNDFERGAIGIFSVTVYAERPLA